MSINYFFGKNQRQFWTDNLCCISFTQGILDFDIPLNARKNLQFYEKKLYFFHSGCNIA